MKFSEEFRDNKLVQEIAHRLRRPEHNLTIMEVCGTHTTSISRFGLRALLPEGVRLVSGPGCPVCVTDQRDIDAFLALGGVEGAILTSFGDMLRVPGSTTSLERLRAAGTDVRMVYSPMDAVEIARQNPDREVVFFGVGFETTTPATALAIKLAERERIRNFSVYCVHKTMPAALRALLTGNDLAVSGLLLPGHVSTITGVRSYDFIAAEFGVPCAVAGFEPVDILLGIESIIKQIESGVAEVSNAYPRAVHDQANEKAQALIGEVFTECDSNWRGLGCIAASGLRISDKYKDWDAEVRFSEFVNDLPAPAEINCRCGDILRGIMDPPGCPLFGTVCTPADPVGPCMVSNEGACAAAYKYGGV